MGEVDWSTTSLGAVEFWPQSLRTTVSTCLASRFPILVWWGRDLVKIYNDAYTPILGGKHPAALGARGRDVWPEIWHIIGPMLEGVLDRGEATWSEDQMLPLSRHGFTEECYFTFSYSPIRDETGGVGGVFTAVSETTERVLAERRLATLHEMGEIVAEAKTIESACERAIAVLAANDRDVPFAAVYLLEGGRWERVAATPQASDDIAPPSLSSADDVWRMGEALGSGAPLVVERDDVRLPGGPWPEPARRALVIPIARPGQTTAYGVLLAGISPRLAFDDAYASFFRLVSQQIASAVANAAAHAEERRRLEALAEIDRAKTAFFSNVSHEFRTPLTLMLAPIEELRASPAQSVADRERVDLVHRNALRLMKLVNDLLEFSRIEAGRVDASYEPTDLSLLTSDLASSFRSAIEGAGLRLVVDCPALAEPAYVDRGMWEKIVLNLVSNAFKFTLEGSVSVRLRADGNAAELLVSDTGAGIAAAELPRIFERFHRVPSVHARSHEGSGIGLALVHELVRLHGGDVRVDSREGQGTTFAVRIPFGAAHLPAERVRAAPFPAPPAVVARAYVEEALRWDASIDDAPRPLVDPARGAGARPARIVVVDDNADMRAYLARLLRDHWDVEAVRSGDEALASIRRSPPDLVVSDVMMPGLDGFGLLRAVRADPDLASTPFILLSARAGEESTAEGLKAGADDYVVKPFSARDMLVRVSTRLEAAQNARRESQERKRLYGHLMQAPFPIGILRGADLVVELANEPLARAWGKDSRTLGRPLREIVPELRDQPFIGLLETVFRSGAPHVGREELARMPTGPGGALVDTYWNYIYAPLVDAGGVTEGVMVCAFDVTPAVLARRDLEQANRSKDEFLATMSHELRTPLNAVLGWATMLRRDHGDPAKLARGLEAIERNAVAQARLVNDLLDVSRIISGKLRLSLRPTEFPAIVRAAAEVVRPAADAKRVRIVIDVDPDVGMTIADPDRLQQVVWNLLTNAVRFTPTAGSVIVSARRAGSLITLRVQDTGAGIAQEQLARIFERFTQVDSSTTRAHGGLGLGLAIVRHLVEAHGGTVSAESDGIGCGATFTVTLPVAVHPTTMAEPAGPEPPLREPMPTKNEVGASGGPPAPRPTQLVCGVRLLLVDDDRDSLELLRVVLEEAGAVVTTATSARQALAASGPFDVVVSDIAMPEVDGYSLLRQLRERRPGADVAAIALTAYARAEDAERALGAGYREHLSKPVSAHDLIEAVRRQVHVQGAC